METIFADMTVSMSEFKKNPATVLRQAGSRPVAVLNHNRAAFYMVEPRLFHAMLAELAGPETSRASPESKDHTPDYRAVVARLGERAEAIRPARPGLLDN